MPADFKLIEARQPPLKDQYDEWLARIICYAFSVPVSPFVSQVNRATSETLRLEMVMIGRRAIGSHRSETENMGDQFEEFSGALSPELLARAYRVPGELAWARADAIEAIDALEKAGFTVLGVEVWLPTSPGPTPTGRYWDPDTEAVIDPALTARDFVRDFRWGRFDEILNDREPYFNLTVAEEES